MSHNLQVQIAAAAIAASALATPAAQAGQTPNFHFESSGTSQVIEVINPQGPVLRFATQTEGSGGFNLTGYLSTDVVDMSTGQGSGSNRFVTVNGDELLGSFTVQVVPTATAGTLRLEGLTQFSGGTGAFAGASGSASFIGSGTFISETRALVSFVHDGQMSMVPEPGSAALLLGGLAAIGVRASRRSAKGNRPSSCTDCCTYC